LILTAGATSGTGNSADNHLWANQATNAVTLSGGAGNDYIQGSLFGDTLIGDTGNDTLVGGAGNDIYYLDSTADIVTEAATSDFDSAYTNVNGIVLAANVEQLILYGSATTGSGNSGVNVLHGTYAASAVTLDGGAGNDTIYGSGYNDTLIGGAGADGLLGGLGNDVYYLDSVLDLVTEAANGGFDSAYATVSGVVLAANVEQLILYSGAVTGFGNAADNSLYGHISTNAVTLDGGAGNDYLLGSAYADTIIGGSGNDTLVGGAGNDIYYVDSVSDAVTEAANGGFDSTYASISGVVLAANVEQLILYNGSATGFGNAADNSLYGHISTNAVTLDGGAGNDYLLGSAYADTLIGGAGNDTLVGANGNDTLSGGLDNDSFVFASGFGRDVITDFSAGAAIGDVLDLSLGSQFDTFAEVMARTTQVGANAVITIDANNTITLQNLQMNTLVANDFRFGA
jgi:Ca2+-binding RTX toxin-like protein